MRAVGAQFVARRGPGLWPWGLLASGLIATAGLQWQVRELNERRQAQQQQAEQHVREVAEAAARAASALQPYAESLAEIAQLRSVQWPQLLASLEVTPRVELQVLAVDLDVAQQRVCVSVGAPAMRTVLEYAQTLQHGTPIGEPAWRFSVGRVTERTGGGVTAELAGRWDRR
jgi:hypothetical protein